MTPFLSLHPLPKARMASVLTCLTSHYVNELLQWVYYSFQAFKAAAEAERENKKITRPHADAEQREHSEAV